MVIQVNSNKIMTITRLLIFILVSLIFSCKPARKLQNAQEAVSKVDTSSIVLAHDKSETDSLGKLKDSADLIREVYSKVINNKINFNTFNAKARVAYTDKNGSNEATAYIRVKKDSVIWISLRGPLGIEGFRLLITPDSVKLINQLQNYVQLRQKSFLEQFAGLPIDFSAMQDLILGNPVFIDSNVSSYTSDSNYLKITMIGNIFKHLAIINNSNYEIVESRLDGINNVNRTCDILYNGYNTELGVPFSTERKVLLTDESKLDINLNFKQYAFNQPVTFPFNVSDNYKRL